MQINRRRSIFLGGPIHYAQLNSKIDAMLQMLITSLFVELEDGYELFSAHRAESFGLESARFTPHEIACRDFEWMKRCESFVAVLPPCNESALRTDGTHIELGWASALGKPIFAVVPLPVPESYNPLVRGLCAVSRVEYVALDEVLRQPMRLREALDRYFEGEILFRSQYETIPG